MSIYEGDGAIGQNLLDSLNSYSLSKWGFVVMRCTYGDDDAWNKFMERLHAVITERPAHDQAAVEVKERHVWTVIADPSLDSAPKEDIRKKFMQWLATDAKAEYDSTLIPWNDEETMRRDVPRYSYCIAVDKDSMESVLADEFKMLGDSLVPGFDAYVNVIRADPDWLQANYPDFTSFNWSQYSEEDNEQTHYDENEEEIEGCRLHDVGWMKFPLFDLPSELWRQLAHTNWHWDHIYVRPNEGIAMGY